MKKFYTRTLLTSFFSVLAMCAQAQFPYTESFKNSSAANVVFGGSPSAFLTAPGIDANGKGYLRFTSATTNQKSFIYSTSTFPSSYGINITFEYYTYGGSGADGITFFLFDATAISNFNVGGFGGSLGYAQLTGSGDTLPGLSKGYIGIGIDEFGNFSNPTEGRQGGPGRIQNSVTIRGSGNGKTLVSTNYPYLTTAAVSSLTGGSRTDTTSSASGFRKAIISLTPRTGGGVLVTVKIQKGSTTTTVISNYAYTATPPAKFAFGLASSTGASTNYHEVRNLTVDIPDYTVITAPTAVADIATTCANTAVDIDVTNNDIITNTGGEFNDATIDLDPSTTGIQTTKTVTGGTFSVNTTTGIVTFTPASGYSGTASGSYTVKDNYGAAASNTATITVTVQTAISNNTLTAPATTTFCGTGDAAVITGATPTGGSGTYTYQWQTSTDGNTFTNISGATSANYDPPSAGQTLYYRRVVTSGSCTSSSASVAIIIQASLAGNTVTAPATTTFCGSGSPGAVTGATPTGGSGTYVYQWQSSADGTTYANVSGATAISYTPPALSSAGTYYYRRQVTSGACSTASSSNAVSFTVQPAIASNGITAPATSTFCGSGDAAAFTASTPTGGSGTYTYQWQSSADSINFANISGATAAAYDPPSSSVTTYYRRVVTSGACSGNNSNAVGIIIQSSLSNNTITAPAISTFCGSSDPGQIDGSTPAGGSGSYTYQWQSSADGTTYTNISGATTVSYDPGVLAATTYFRRLVTSGSCTTASTSNVITITIQPVLSGNTVTAPATTVFCSSGDPGVITGATPSGGNGTYAYQWQSSTDGSTFTNISGANTISYDPPAISTTTYYRRQVTSGSCSVAASSNVITVTVQAALGNNTVTAPATITFCGSGDAAVVTGSTPTGGSGTYTYQWQSSADGTNYTNISGATAASYDPPSASVTTYYKRQATSGSCTVASASNVVTITIQPAVSGNTINTPSTSTFCGSGDAAVISGSTPAGGNGTYTYQWQSSADGTTFTNVSGATSASYDPPSASATTYYRRLVTSGSCTTASTSNVVTITIESAITANGLTAPATTTFCGSGTPGTITGSTPAGGSGTYSYQWQGSSDGTNYSNISSGGTSKDYTPGTLNIPGTYYYRRLVTSGSCTSSSISDVVTVTVQAAIAGNTVAAPATTTFCGSGDAAVITGATPTGGSGTYTYQWQSSADGTTYTNISGATAASYDPPAATTTTYYRRQVTSGSCTVASVSNVVTITIESVLANNSVAAPATTTFCGNGTPGAITGNTPTGGNGSYTYQWQLSTDGATYNNITTGGGGKDYTPPQLTAAGTYYYRRLVTSGSCSAASTSNIVTITVQAAADNNTITAPATTTFCGSGDAAVITGSTPTGGSGTYTYQWQSSADGTTFTNISGATAISYDPPFASATTYYRRLVTSGSCTSASISNMVTVTIQPALAGNTITAPATTTFCGSGDAAVISGGVPTGGSGSYTYQWQSSADGTSFTDISGAVSASYDPPASSATTYYRRQVTSGSCTTAISSNVVTVTIQPALDNNTLTAPATTTFCGSGDPAVITGSTPTGGSGTYTYQWQTSADGASFADISGATSASYDAPVISATTYYRRLITSGTCTTPVASAPVVITVQAAVAGNTITAPATTTFCGSGDAGVITAASPTGGSGTYSYQWQSSADSISFTNISGATSATYDPPAATVTTYYRRVVTSGSCTTGNNSNVIGIRIQSAISNNTVTAPGTTIFCSSGDAAVISGSTPAGGDGTNYNYQWQSSPDGTTFSNIGGATSASYDPPAASVTTYYRRLVTSGSCSVASISNTVTIIIQPAIAGNTLTAPATTTFCGTGDPAVINGSTPTGGNGTSYTYQWQSSADGTTYTVISGATAANYDPPAVSATTYFRRAVTSGSCTAAVFSNVIQITVQAAVSGNTVTAPATTTFCGSGDAAVITGATPSGGDGTTYVYQWQSSTDNATFANITGATAVSFDPPSVNQTTYYRRLVTSGSCNTPAASNVITITVQPALAANTVTAPATTTFCGSGDAAVITGSTPTGGSGTYTYQWQTSSDGTTYANVPGATSASYDPPSVSVTTYYRRLVTSGSCTSAAVSNVVTITIQSAVANNTITAPATTTFCGNGDPAAIAGSTPTGASGTYTYQWQSSLNGTTFTDISGATGASYDPAAISQTTYYRRQVTSGSCTTSNTSNVVTITVQAAISANTLTQPTPNSFCGSGTPGTITGSTPAGGSGTYTYQWQSSTDGSTYSNITTGGASINYTPPALTTAGTYYYRRLVTSGACAVANASAPVQFTLVAAVDNNAITAPATTTFCVSGDADVITGSTPTGGSGTYVYQWQSSTDNSTFTNISGATAISYDPAAATQTTYYRRLVASSTCSTASVSNSVAVIIQAAIANNSITAVGATNYCGRYVLGTADGSAPTGGDGTTYTYQWQYSTDGGVTFKNGLGIANQEDYAYTDTLPPGTYTLKRVVTSGACTAPASSNSLTYVVQAPLGNNRLNAPATTAYCGSVTGSPVIAGSTPSGGDGSYTYQWQSSASAATGYTNISGATGVDYTIPGTQTTSLYYRRAVTSGYCTTPLYSDSVLVTVTVAPGTANAGPVQRIAATSTTLAGNAPASGETGSWIQVSGPNTANIANAALYNTGVSGLAAGNYVFRWSLSTASPCAASTDTMSIEVLQAAVALSDNFPATTGVTATLNILANDIAGSVALSAPGTTITITQGSTNGSTIVVNGNNTIDYTSAASGGDNFQYYITDANGVISNTTTVTINSNSAPSAVNDTASTAQGTPVAISVAANDNDPDGTLALGTVTIISPASNGSLSVNTSTGVVTYTPLAGFYGNDAFTYTINDNTGATSNVATVNITVFGRPVANADNTVANINAAVTIPVLANDTDPENSLNAGSVAITTPATGGTAVANPDGTVTYTPPSNTSGTYTFAYTVTDNQGVVSAPATVTVRVNAAPVAVNDSAQTNVFVPVTFSLVNNDTDADGTVVASSIVLTQQPANGFVTINANGTITYSPNGGFTGRDSLFYTIEDNDDAVSNAAVAIINVNAGPVAGNDTDTTNVNTPVTIAVTANDTDANGVNNNSVIVLTQPANGTAVVGATSGTIVYTPATGYSGNDNFTYIVRDNLGAVSNTANVAVFVNTLPVAVNDTVVTGRNIAVTRDVTANDYDADLGLNRSSVVIVTPPVHGTYNLNNATGEITYTSTGTYTGADSIRYTIKDVRGATSNVAVMLVNINAAPVAADDIAVTNQDTAVVVPVLNNDTDAGGTIVPSTVTVVTPPAHGTVSLNTTTGAVTYTPDADYYGTDTFYYTVKDNNGLVSNAAQVRVSVNAKPVANPDNAIATLNSSTNIDLVANDTDADGSINPASIAIVSGASNGTVTVNANGTVSYTPNTNFAGTDQFSYTVRDNNGVLSNTAIVNVTVNRRPDAVDDSVITNVNTAVIISVAANDTDADGTLDLTSLSVVTSAANGVLVNNNNGTFTYTPAANYAGADVFTYTIKDNNGGVSDTAIVTIRVNQPPVAVNDSAVVINGQTTALFVLTNDTDADGTINSASVVMVTDPVHGTAAANANGRIIYTPASGFSGVDSLRYTVLDNNGAVSNIATVRIRVNASPVAVNDSANTNRNTPVTINVAVNDTDADGTIMPSSAAIIDLPANGTLTAGATPGSFVYTPNTGFTGIDRFTYRIKDNDGGNSNLATVTVRVLAGPATVNDNAAANQNQAVTIPVLANDTDAEGTIVPGSVAIVTPPAHGTVTINTTTGEITYTPATDYYGSDNFTYTVQDNNGVTSPATNVALWINALPVAGADSATLVAGTPVIVPVADNDTDPDGTLDLTSVTIVGAPLHGTVAVNTTTGAITYTPASGYYGADSFSYTIKDNYGAFSAPATVKLTVNASPVAVGDSVIVLQNTTQQITVLTNDSDVDGTLNAATVTLVTAPLHGTTSVSAAGVISYVPATGYTGIDSLFYTVQDNLGAVSNIASVYILVGAIPVATNDSAVTNLNTAVTINVTDNDTDAANDLDINSTVIVTAPAHGTVTAGTAPGTYVYTPATGYTGADNFSYTISDTVGLVSLPATVYIKVNAAPVAVPDTISVNPGVAVTVPVTNNDTDADGTIEVNTVTIVNVPIHGTATVSASGVITYTPAAGYSGADSLTYTIKDNDGAVSNQGVVRITVFAAPVATADTITVNQGAASVLAITVNDAAAGGSVDPATITIVTPPAHGTVTVSASGVVTYVPLDGYSGVDSFTYTVRDNNGSVSLPGKVSLTVNALPVAADDNATTAAGRSVTVPVLNNDTDADGTLNSASVTVTAQPQNGTVTVNPATGVINYVPNVGFSGNDNFTYTVADNRGAVSAPASVRVTVNPLPGVNADNAVATRDSAVRVDVLANDVAANGTLNPATVTITTQPQHGTVSVDPVTGVITYTPASGYTGVDSFAYTVQSSDGTVSDPATVSLRVYNPPTAVGEAYFVNQNSSVTLDVLNNDISPNNIINPAMLMLVDTFRHGYVFIASDSSYAIYTPFPGFYGVDSFTYRLKDSVGALSNIALVTVTVNAVPVAVADSASGIEGSAVAIDVTANDTDADGAVDKTTVTITTQPQHGTVTVDAVTGVVTYTPATGYSGTDNFNYTIKDNLGAVSAPASGGVNIFVGAKPVAVPDVVVVNQKDTLRADVTANDVAANSAIDKTTVTIVTAPQHGTASVNPVTGVISYVPDSGYYGIDSFTYTVKDTSGVVSLPGKVSVAVNSLPVASNYAATTVQDTPVSVDVSGNDVDLDGTIDHSSVTIVMPPKHGTAVVDSRGIVTYTPAPGFIGMDTLSYNEKDNLGGVSNAALLIITVDDRPLANHDTASTVQNTPVAIDVTGNDSDSGSGIDKTSVTIVTPPEHGSVTIDPVTGVVTYSPDPNYTGLDSFRYTIRDKNGVEGTAAATVSVGIKPVPVAAADKAVVVEGTAAAVDVTANDSSPAGINKSTVTITTQPQHGTVTVDPVTGVVTYVPQPGYTGLDNFSYTVRDSAGTVSAPASVSLTVYNRPVAGADNAKTIQDTPVTINVTGNDTDASGTVNAGSVAITTQPQHGTVTVNSTTGQVTYTPAAGFSGADSFRYTITDNNGAVSQPGLVTVTVNGKPVTTPDAAPVVVDATVVIDVLANDSIPGGTLDKSSVTIVLAPAHGTVSVDTTTGMISYTPAPGYVGTDTFTYTVRDGLGTSSNPTGVSVIVSQRPIANTDGNVLTYQNVPVTIPVLDNDLSVDHALIPSSVTVVTPPVHGTVTVDTVTGRITYTPQPGYTGVDSFRYTVVNSNGVVSLPGLVTIAVNGYPVANPDSVSTNPGKAIAIDVTFNDSPFDHVSLNKSTVTVTSQPARGTVVLDAVTGIVTYTPNSGFTGTDVFNYTVRDSAGAVSNAAQVTVVVNATNVPPKAVDDSLATNINTVVIINVAANDVIAGNGFDSSSLTIVARPAHGTITTTVATGRVIYTPAPGFTGLDSFTYTIRDKNGLLSNVATVYITVSVNTSGPAANTDEAATSVSQPVTIDVTANDVPIAGTTLNKASVIATTSPQHGTITIDSAGRITYMPVAGYSGSDFFTYTIADNNGTVSNAALVFVNINRPPVAVNDTATTTVNTGRVIRVPDNDYDTDGLLKKGSVTVTTAPLHGTFTVDATTGNITYTPATAYTGIDSLRYIIRDNNGTASNVATVLIRVNATNTAPVAVADNVATPKNTPRVMDVTANDTDVDGTIDPKTVTIVSQPTKGTVTVDAVTGKVTYTPGADYTGTDAFTYTVKDNLGTVSNVATVNIQVNAVNQVPVANDDVVLGEMNTPVTFRVTGNDTDPDGNIDSSTIVITRLPKFGTLSLDSATGVFTYTPGFFYVGADDFTYTVKDNSSSVSNDALVTIIVQPVNEGPVTRADSAATAVNTVAAINITANDMDADGNLIYSSIVITRQPQHGSVTVNPTNGMVTYTPATGFVGLDSISYTIEDNSGSISAVTPVIIRVGLIAPVAVNDQAATTVNIPVNITVTANDTDADGTLLPSTVTIVRGAAVGVATVGAGGVVTYVPRADFVGVDSFQYVVRDNSLNASNVASVYVTVGSVIIPPVANRDSAFTTRNTAVAIDVTANDTDLDGTVNKATVTVTAQPAHGVATVNTTTGVVTYTPVAGYSGLDSLRYTVKDDKGNTSNVASVIITITVPNAAPVAKADSATTLTNAAVNIDVTANDTDSDGTINKSTVTVTTQPVHGVVTINAVTGIATYTPAAGYTGVDSFRYTVKDNLAAVSNIATVIITTGVANKPPVAVADTVTTTTATPAVIDVTANDTDTDGTILKGSVTITTQPLHGVVSVNTATGVVTYTPVAGYNGVDSFKYTVADNNGNVSAPGVVHITVGAPNAAPVAVRDSASVSQGSSVTVDVTANDRDSDGTLNKGSVTIVTLPAHGSVTVNPATGQVTYTPAAGYTGKDSFSYTIKDNLGSVSNTAMVTITVNPASGVALAKAMASAVRTVSGAYDITYVFTLTNSGNDTLRNVQVTDNLSTVFTGAASITVKSLNASGALAANSLYDGSGNINLLTGNGQLLPGKTDSITLVVTVMLGAEGGTFNNTATATATGRNNTSVSDQSVNGRDPQAGGNASTPVVLSKPVVSIPNGFSPNNDGVNDRFVIQNLGNRKVHLEVYNRWGNIVFKDVNYGNTWEGQCNQGVRFGNKLPDGTYFYVVVVEGGEKYVGYITLKR